MNVQAETFRAQGRSRHARLFKLLLFSGLFVATVCGANLYARVNPAQSSLTGEWLIDFSRKNPDEVQFTVFRRTLDGKKHESGDGVLLSEFQGLTREAAFGAGNVVRFRLVREAGTFDLEGSFRAGKGAGHWTLTPNPAFISAMRGRGYDNLNENDLFAAARHDIKLKSIDELNSAGYDRLTFKEIVEANIFNVNAEYIAELRAAGYEHLTFKELVEARIFDIDRQYIKDVSAMGFERQPLKKLIEIRIHKITPEFIKEMRSLGFENLSLRELTDLSIYKITPAFVNELKTEGFNSISPRDAINLKIHRIDAPFIRRVKAQGFARPTIKQLLDLRIHGKVK